MTNEKDVSNSIDKDELRRAKDRERKAREYYLKRDDPEYRRKERERLKKFYQENKERITDTLVAWAKNPDNAEKLKESKQKSYIKKKERMKIDPEFKARCSNIQREANLRYKLKKKTK